MKSVGVRQLKNRLSEYLREIRAGEAILVTDRGQIIAELAPPRAAADRDAADASATPGLSALARQGLATLPSRREAASYPALPRRRRKYSAKELLDDERGSR